MADVSALFIKHDSRKKVNYRLICLLPARYLKNCCTINCMNMRPRVYCAGTRMNIWFPFSPLLCGFRSGYNAEQAVINFVENCKTALDSGWVAGAVLMDNYLSIAFDLVNHELLIAKLNAFGLSYGASMLIHSNFSCRQQRVKLKVATVNGNSFMSRHCLTIPPSKYATMIPLT